MAFKFSPCSPCCCERGICVTVNDYNGAPQSDISVGIGYFEPNITGLVAANGVTDATGVFCATDGYPSIATSISISKDIVFPATATWVGGTGHCDCDLAFKPTIFGGFAWQSACDSGSGIFTMDPPGGPQTCKPFDVAFKFCPPATVCVNATSSYDGSVVPVIFGEPNAFFNDILFPNSGCLIFCPPASGHAYYAKANNANAPMYLDYQSCWGNYYGGFLAGSTLTEVNVPAITGCGGYETSIVFCDCIADCARPVLCSPIPFRQHCLPGHESEVGCWDVGENPPCHYPGTFNGTRWDYNEPDSVTWEWTISEDEETHILHTQSGSMNLAGIPNPDWDVNPRASKYSGYTSGWQSVDEYVDLGPRLGGPQDPDGPCFFGPITNPDYYIGVTCCKLPDDSYLCGVKCGTETNIGGTCQDMKVCTFDKNDVVNDPFFNRNFDYLTWIRVNAGLCGGGSSSVTIEYLTTRLIGLSFFTCDDEDCTGQQTFDCTVPSPCNCMPQPSLKRMKPIVMMAPDGKQVIVTLQDAAGNIVCGVYLNHEDGNDYGVVCTGGPCVACSHPTISTAPDLDTVFCYENPVTQYEQNCDVFGCDIGIEMGTISR